MSSRIILASVAFLLACGPNDEVPGVETPTGPVEPIRELPRPLTETEQAIVAGSNDFAFRLLQRIAATDSSANIVLSPLSASFALGMLLNGAANQTWSEMSGTLGFEGMTQAEINRGYASLLELLVGLDPAVRFDVGNSVWAREGYVFEPAFMDTVRHYFDATTRTLDFSEPGAVDEINKWVSDATNQRIEEILDAISPDQVMFLINAIYMKGDWTEPFDPRNTQPSSFRRRDGSSVEVPTMYMDQGTHLFADLGDGTKVLELLYGGEAFGMVFVQLPEDVDAFDAAAGLTQDQWDGWIAALDTAPALIRMPKYELEYERTMNDDLIALGMPSAFGEGADFSRLAGGVWIDFVKQKTFLKVDEVGTEAAAVTVVAVAESLGPHIFLDRPFLFAIRERLTGTILFIGVIGDPS